MVVYWTGIEGIVIDHIQYLLLKLNSVLYILIDCLLSLAIVNVRSLTRQYLYIPSSIVDIQQWLGGWALLTIDISLSMGYGVQYHFSLNKILLF